MTCPNCILLSYLIGFASGIALIYLLLFFVTLPIHRQKFLRKLYIREGRE